MSKLTTEQLARLHTAVDNSRTKLRPFRENRLATITSYVGSHYGDNGTKEKMPVNLMELAASIYTRNLVSNSPQVLVGTRYRDLRPTASTLELAINQQIKDMGIETTLRDVVLEAMFSIGIVKVGLSPEGTVEIGGVNHDVGKPFVDVVPFSDFVFDTTAKRWEDVQFMGNRYCLPLDVVKSCGMFKNVKDLSANTARAHDVEEVNGADQLTNPTLNTDDSYKEMVYLWDIWLPMDGIVITVVDGSGGELIREVEWEGPEYGPYIILRYSPVPENVMPLPPVALWEDINELANMLMRKIGRQATRQKTIVGVQGGADADGNRIVAAGDGDMIRLDNPNAVKEFSFGGAEPTSIAFLIQLRDMFSYMAGNLDSLGGLSPMADTLGQEQMLGASASKRLQDMQAQTVQFVKKICHSLAYYLWTDPIVVMPLTKKIQGTDIEIPVTWTSSERRGHFIDYGFSVAPYSMRDQSPGVKLKMLMDLSTQLILPLMPMMQSQGISFNFEKFLKLVAKYGDMPEMEEFVEFIEPNEGMPPQQASQGGNPVVPKPSMTTRRYERVNRPGANVQGKNQAMMASLLGASVQPKEQAGAMRPVS